MSEAIQLRPGDAMAEWSVIRSQSEVLIKSGFLPPSIKTPEQAMAIILTGRELGVGPMAALNTINVIQGKPAISPQLMLALINRSGQLEDIAIDASIEGATVAMKRRGRQPYTAFFGPREAAAMGLAGKDNYKKQAATMYKWRAVADAARVVFPDVVLGMYLPDEMGAEVDTETGEVIEMPRVAPQIAAAAPEPTDEDQETNPSRLAVEAQRPLDSQLQPKTRAALGAIMTTLRDELRVSVEDLQEEMRASTGKTSRDELTEEQGRGMLGIYELLATQLRSKKPSIVPDDSDIPF